jgi:hypothetical protein
MFGASVDAEDGEIGKLIDFLFDDRDWTVKCLVLDAGDRTGYRRMTLPPHLVLEKDWQDRRLTIAGSASDRIENSSDEPTHADSENSTETETAAIAGWSLLWRRIVKHPRHNIENSHLLGAEGVIKYHLHETDGRLGRLVDFLIDEESWKIRFIEADTGAWWPGKRVLIPPERIESIDAAKRVLRLDISRHALKQSLVYHPAMEEAHSCETAASGIT